MSPVKERNSESADRGVEALSDSSPTQAVTTARALIRPDRCCAWRGSSLLVVSARGECEESDLVSGFYYREARFLRTCRLEINNQRTWLCEAAEISPTHLE